jgi:hypothetical protein
VGRSEGAVMRGCFRQKDLKIGRKMLVRVRVNADSLRNRVSLDIRVHNPDARAESHCMPIIVPDAQALPDVLDVSWERVCSGVNVIFGLSPRALAPELKADLAMTLQEFVTAAFASLERRKRVVIAPGTRLERLTQFLLTPKAHSVYVVPAIRDMQVQYFEAVRADHKWLARYIVLRGHLLVIPGWLYAAATRAAIKFFSA